MKLHLPMYMLCDGALGCDCPAKRKASGKRWRNGPPQHGERRMYQIGCRCDECVLANKIYVNKYRNKEKTDGNFGTDRAA